MYYLHYYFSIFVYSIICEFIISNFHFHFSLFLFLSIKQIFFLLANIHFQNYPLLFPQATLYLMYLFPYRKLTIWRCLIYICLFLCSFNYLVNYKKNLQNMIDPSFYYTEFRFIIVKLRLLTLIFNLTLTSKLELFNSFSLNQYLIFLFKFTLLITSLLCCYPYYSLHLNLGY